MTSVVSSLMADAGDHISVVAKDWVAEVLMHLGSYDPVDGNPFRT